MKPFILIILTLMLATSAFSQRTITVTSESKVTTTSTGSNVDKLYSNTVSFVTMKGQFWLNDSHLYTNQQYYIDVPINIALMDSKGNILHIWHNEKMGTHFIFKSLTKGSYTILIAQMPPGKGDEDIISEEIDYSVF